MRVVVLPAHADVDRLEAALEQPERERVGRLSPDHLLLEHFLDVALGARDDAREHVVVAVEVFRGGVDHDVGAVLDRPEVHRAREGRVHDEREADFLREVGDRPEVEHAAGRVHRRLDEDRARLLAQPLAPRARLERIHQRDVDAVPAELLREQAVRAAVDLARSPAGGRRGGAGRASRTPSRPCRCSARATPRRPRASRCRFCTRSAFGRVAVARVLEARRRCRPPARSSPTARAARPPDRRRGAVSPPPWIAMVEKAWAPSSCSWRRSPQGAFRRAGGVVSTGRSRVHLDERTISVGARPAMSRTMTPPRGTAVVDGHGRQVVAPRTVHPHQFAVVDHPHGALRRR